MRHHLSRLCAGAQFLALMLLAGCATAPERVVVSVKAPVPRAPEACRTRPAAPDALPDRDMQTVELAQHYARLRAQYLRQGDRLKLCQKFVSRLGE